MAVQGRKRILTHLRLSKRTSSLCMFLLICHVKKIPTFRGVQPVNFPLKHGPHDTSTSRTDRQTDLRQQ